MSFRIVIVLFFALLMFFSQSLFAGSETDQNAQDNRASNEIAAAVAVAWTENRARFDTMICQFELTRWVTDSMESVGNGAKIPSRGFAECEWRKNGEHQLFRIDADPARNPETLFDGGDGFTYGTRAYTSKTYLMDGMLWMSIANGSGTIHMSGGNRPRALTPFSLTSIPRLSANGDSGAGLESTLCPREDDPPGLLRIEVSGTDDNRSELVFDVSSQVKLIQAEHSNLAEILRIDVLDYQKCPNGGLFPIHIRRTISSKQSPDEIIVDECRVTELRTEVSFEGSDLAVQFEAGAAINAPTLGNMAMTKMVKPRSVNSSDLRSLVAECEATESRTQAARFQHSTASAPPFPSWPSIVLGASFAVVALLVLVRNRKVHRSGNS